VVRFFHYHHIRPNSFSFAIKTENNDYHYTQLGSQLGTPVFDHLVVETVENLCEASGGRKWHGQRISNQAGNLGGYVKQPNSL